MSPPSSTAAASEASADIVTPYHNPCPTMFWSTYVCPLSVESQMESLGASTAASVSPSAEDEMENHACPLAAVAVVWLVQVTPEARTKEGMRREAVSRKVVSGTQRRKTDFI